MTYYFHRFTWLPFATFLSTNFDSQHMLVLYLTFPLYAGKLFLLSLISTQQTIFSTNIVRENSCLNGIKYLIYGRKFSRMTCNFLKDDITTFGICQINYFAKIRDRRNSLNIAATIPSWYHAHLKKQNCKKYNWQLNQFTLNFFTLSRKFISSCITVMKSCSSKAILLKYF